MTWNAEAACTGMSALMFDRYRQHEAGTICATCPVSGICLWTAMAAEAEEPPYRYGMAGGLIPLRRAELGERLSAAEIADRLADALDAHAGARSRYRPLRRCAGCPAPVSSRRAYPPRRWCSASCKKRTESIRPWLRARTAHCRRCARPVPQARMGRPRDFCSIACREASRFAALSAEERAALAAERRRRRAERAAA